MLWCGRQWQPTLIKRVIEPLPTSTCVAKVATDAGNGFLKGMGNPAGNHSLATELVAAELALGIGLRVPPFAVIRVAGIEIPMVDSESLQFGIVQPGPAFISCEVDGQPGDGGDVFLSKTVNPEDVSKLVIFDTWIRNADRCSPDPERAPYNRDNLFFAREGRKFALMAIDHSHCFVEGSLDDLLGPNDLMEDETIYGYFPEFAPFIQAYAVASAVRRLRQIDIGMVHRIMNSVPQEWGVTARMRAAWVSLICGRAQRVANFISARLVDNPCLEL
jgi:hypothetical protein